MSTATAEDQRNPFPGLRPFREDEEYLFFGRENQVDAMVDKLAATHFLAVVGTSGSGKSSLVNSGLRPALHGGLMARAGTTWRMAQFRPGSNPMRAMARALAEDGVLFRDYQAGGLTLAEIVDTTLRMSKLGLIDIYEQAQLAEDVNLLVVVDQFEELFRYRQPGAGQQPNVMGVSEDAIAFVNLLLAVKEQTRNPIYVVLTMRSDFLGDCSQFTGLAEAINAGQYLVPRMTREERRAAISGPVGVGGAEISPVLLTRLVNDVGDNPDQLSILQHALNRTWNQWQRSQGNGPLDLPHYQAIGTMAHALDQHAEKAYAELTTPRQRQICEKLFKALTDKATDPRGVRRPTKLDTLCALAEATPAEVTQVIDVFRKPSRSFLMPPAEEALEAETVIDISHESLMRVWERLKIWTDEEAQSAHIYSRLAETAVLHGAGQAGLWQDPDLQVALKWNEQNQPNEGWARRYHPDFANAMRFLKTSKTARGRRRWILAGITLFVFTALAGLLVWALLARNDAKRQTIITAAVGAKDLLDTRPSDGLIAAIVSADDARQAFSPGEIPLAIRASLIEAVQLLRAGGVPRNSWVAHTGEIVTSVAMSSDGQTIVTGGWDRKVRLWDKEGKPIGQPFVGHTQDVKSVAISSDGQTIASAGLDGILIWNRQGGEPKQLPAQGVFSSVDMTSDGQTFAVAGAVDGFLMNRNGTPLNHKAFGGVPGNKPTVSISGDGQTVLRFQLGKVQLSDGKGEDLWKSETESEKDEDRDRSNGASSAAISRDGQTIVIGYQNGYVRLWNRQGKALVQAPEEGEAHEGRVTCVAVSTDGQTIASGGEEGTVRLWDREAKPVGPSLTGHDGRVNSVAMSADGRLIVSAGDDGMVRLWERQTPSPPVKAYEGKVGSIAFSGDGQTIRTAGPEARVLQWDRNEDPGKATANARYENQATATATVTATAWGPGGELLIIGRSDGKLLRRNQRDPAGDQLFAENHAAGVTSIAVSSDGKTIVSGDENGTVRLWDREGRPIGQPSKGHDGRVVSVAISSNGQMIVSGGADGKVLRWNLQGSAVLPPLSISYSTGKGETVAVSPNGRIIVSGSERGMMRLWDGQGNPIRVFKAHEANIDCLAFSLDGEMIVSGSDDGTVRLWDGHGRPVGQPSKGHEPISSAAISPDGTTLVVGDKAGNVMVRRFSIDIFLQEACDWLRYHRALRSPETVNEKRAAEIARSLLKS
jgi:WD40 repeat protein/energy-coupling factor transporter ATP-binding protein EcfA2